MAIYPAIDVRSGAADVIPAIVDDFRPTAIEERADAIRVFFVDTTLRDAAGVALCDAGYDVQPVGVDDEDWARRSQENLGPVIVGRITVAPPADDVAPAFTGARAGVPQALRRAADVAHVSGPAVEAAPASSATVVIRASMGFGTGHHATTRLCLRALQAVDLADRFVLDVGTGSGVLAITAVKLGAARAAGIDCDADAIHAANENLQLNPGVESVEFQVADVSAGDLPEADVITANLTAAMLIRSASRLLDLLRPDGVLIVSGLLEDERDDVIGAFGDAALGGHVGPHAGINKARRTADRVRPACLEDARSEPIRPADSTVGRVLLDPPVLWEQHEDGWVALAMKRS